MPTDSEQYETIRAQSLQQIADLRAQPKPTYQIDGQNVSWDTYIASLERTVDWCDKKLAELNPPEEPQEPAAEPPFEIRSQGRSGE